MKKVFIFPLSVTFFLMVLSTVSFSALHSTKPENLPKVKVFESYEKLPLSFVENREQLNGNASYYLKGRNGSIYFTKEAMVYDLYSLPQDKSKNTSTLEHNKRKALNRFSFIIKPIGANRDVRLYAKNQLPGKINYLLGDNPKNWQTGIPLYKEIIYTQLYRGIDLNIYGTNNQMEYDFIVSPGADPGAIRLECEGIDALKVDNKGNLLIKTPFGELKHLKPIIYQKIGKSRYNVNGSFVVSKNTFSFDIKNYNKDYALIIDPLTLSYSTYLGGDDNDGAFEMTVDSSGNAYVTGYTWSNDFPSWSGYQWINWGKRDIFVTKFRQSDNTLLYSTFLGGSDSETGRAIAADSSGNAYVTGYTDSTDFPVENAYQATYGGGNTDVFISKLSPDGASLVYSTFLGGSKSDWGYGIAVDSSGNAYVTGETYSTTFPTNNAYQLSGGGTYDDAFVTKLSPSGNAVSYSTYLGGSKNDWGNAIAVDSSGSAYLTGGTKSTDFPVHNAYQATHGGGDTDVFISKLTPAGTTLTYSTFLGGGKGDWGKAIYVDSSENAYVTGYTESTDFPTQNPYQAAYRGGSFDAFISKLSPTGSSISYSTYLGGSNSDWGNGIAVDSSGHAYAIGTTESTDFPIQDAYQGTYAGGDTDVFISKLSPAGTTLTYSTFLGGGKGDLGNTIAVDASGNVYVAGQTESTDFPIKDAYQGLFGGGNRDCFFTKLEAETQNISPTANAGPDQSVIGAVSVTLDGSMSTDPDDGIDTFQWSQVSGSTVTLSDSSDVKPTFTAPTVMQICESLVFQLTVTDHSGLQDTDNVVITVCPETVLLYPDGDIAPFGNPDGIVNVGDALIALRFALGMETPAQEDITNGDVAPLDMDGMPSPDGAITVGDALVILRKALGLVSWSSEDTKNTPATTITGPGGSKLTTPVGGLNGGATIQLTETTDTSGLVESGETQVSKALVINTSKVEALMGDGTFSLSIPVETTKVNDLNKLELKVKLTTGVAYPVFGVYDTKTGAFLVELSGVMNGWIITVVENPSIQIILASAGDGSRAVASKTERGWLTDQNWKTFAWHVMNHTNMSEADIRANILPVLWDASLTLSKANFRSPKIYIDPRLTPEARVAHLIGGIGQNKKGSHFHTGIITYPNGTWIYTEEQATFDSTSLDDEQMSALGQLYINYDQYLYANHEYGTSLGNIVIHELYHAVQYGYDIRRRAEVSKKSISLDAYLEGTATALGQTYQDTGGSITGPNVSVRTLRPNEHARLYQPADNYVRPDCYTKQDFFVYVTKRYGGNSLAWTDQLFEYMNTWTAGKFNLSTSQYRELYRKAMDEVFQALFQKGLSQVYREYALDRAYEHSAYSVLRPAKETVQNGFGQNHLAKTLFKWDNNDTDGLKELDPKGNATTIEFPTIEPLSCYAFSMTIPSRSEGKEQKGFPLVFNLEGGKLLPSVENGIKIFAFLEDSNEDMVENGTIEITDVSKPVQIPFIENAVNLKVLIMNCYLEDKNAKVTVSAGPYIEKAEPNPATPQGQVTLEGISFGATQNGSELSFGNETITEIASWSNTKIIFNLPDGAESGKLKVTVNGIVSNEIQLDVGEKEGPTFQFTQTWDVEHMPYSADDNLIHETVNVNGQVSNGLNPIIKLKNFSNTSDAKIVEISNLKPSEVVTVKGTIQINLSPETISPETLTDKHIYSYSNPKLLRYDYGELVETSSELNFTWVIPSSLWQDSNLVTDFYVEYDQENQYYSRPDVSSPFTHVVTHTNKIWVFHLRIEAVKNFPE